MAERARRYQQGLRDREGVTRAAETFVAEHGDLVQAGPFAGMRYPTELLTKADVPVAKLLGRYEPTLVPAIERMLRFLSERAPATFVDLGCADGFYAVGVARSISGVTVESFDLAPSARAATAALARANGVANVNLRSGASPRVIRKLAPSTSALLCDIEGAELDVLNEQVTRGLAHAFVIVEMHEGARPGVGAELLRRFKPTHDAEVIELPANENGPAGTEEGRTTDLRWGVFTPISHKRAA